MDSPTIIRAAETNKEQVKGVLKLGFANDALLRWVFPDAKAYLESFDHWMEEYSKISFKHDICFAEASGTITIKNLKGVKGENNKTFPKSNLIDEIKKLI